MRRQQRRQPIDAEAPPQTATAVLTTERGPREDKRPLLVSGDMVDAFSDDVVPGQRRAIPLEVSALTVILAIALAVVAGAGAALYQRSKPTGYLSFSVLAIDQPIAVSNDPGDSTLDKLQRLRGYYAGYLKTSLLADPIAAQVKLPVGEVEASLTTAISASNYLIYVFATSSSPTESNTIAQAATSQLISFVRKKQPTINPINRVVLTEVTNPAAGFKVKESTKKVLISAAVAFVVVGAAFIIVADLLRRRW
jgi:hypothetical protein